MSMHVREISDRIRAEKYVTNLLSKCIIIAFTLVLQLSDACVCQSIVVGDFSQLLSQ